MNLRFLLVLLLLVLAGLTSCVIGATASFKYDNHGIHELQLSLGAAPLTRMDPDLPPLPEDRPSMDDILKGIL